LPLTSQPYTIYTLSIHHPPTVHTWSIHYPYTFYTLFIYYPAFVYALWGCFRFSVCFFSALWVISVTNVIQSRTGSQKRWALLRVLTIIDNKWAELSAPDSNQSYGRQQPCLFCISCSFLLSTLFIRTIYAPYTHRPRTVHALSP
jgi:hypothetical protein